MNSISTTICWKLSETEMVPLVIPPSDFEKQEKACPGLRYSAHVACASSILGLVVTLKSNQGILKILIMLKNASDDRPLLLAGLLTRNMNVSALCPNAILGSACENLPGANKFIKDLQINSLVFSHPKRTLKHSLRWRLMI
uniref:Uncharacterized protein n=1 Tax=Compsopogon caeruleus TaxID=31354 RepID=A0A6T6BGC1_9RHOD